MGDAPVSLDDELHRDSTLHTILSGNLRIAHVLGHVLVESSVATRELGHLLHHVEVGILRFYPRHHSTCVYRFRGSLYQHLLLTVNHIHTLNGTGINGHKFFLRHEFAVEIRIVFLSLCRHPQAGDEGRDEIQQLEP